MRKEDSLAQQIATYLNTQYPKIVYHFDAGSGARLPIGLAMKNKRLNKHTGWPDLFIAEQRFRADTKTKDHAVIVRPISGLFLELKVTSPFLKDGVTLKKDDHLRNQYLLHEVLRSKGYEVHFGVGFDNCKKLIDEYLNP